MVLGNLTTYGWCYWAKEVRIDSVLGPVFYDIKVCFQDYSGYHDRDGRKLLVYGTFDEQEIDAQERLTKEYSVLGDGGYYMNNLRKLLVNEGRVVKYFGGFETGLEFWIFDKFDPPFKTKDPRNFLGTITNYNKNAYPNDGISRRFLLYS